MKKMEIEDSLWIGNHLKLKMACRGSTLYLGFYPYSSRGKLNSNLLGSLVSNQVLVLIPGNHSVNINQAW